MLTFVLAAVLPCLGTGVIVASFAGWTGPRALLLCALAVAFALRIGWRGLMPRPEVARAEWALLVFVPLLAGLLFAPIWLPVEPGDGLFVQDRPMQWPGIAGAALIALCGLVRRIVLWREPELLADLLTAREREPRRAS
ncbi:MAG TPA: hypothetical protein VF384_16165 [Planctomycetota bacterium]